VPHPNVTDGSEHDTKLKPTCSLCSWLVSWWTCSCSELISGSSELDRFTFGTFLTFLQTSANY